MTTNVVTKVLVGLWSEEHLSSFGAYSIAGWEAANRVVARRQVEIQTRVCSHCILSLLTVLQHATTALEEGLADFT